jgi:hypothetical protein
MGFLDSIFLDARIARKLRVLDEARAVDATVVHVDEGSFGGFVAYFRSGQARHAYAESHRRGVGLEGLQTEPGEHHALLPVPVPTAAAFVVERSAWWSNDPALAWALQQLEPTLGLGAQNWRWWARRGGSTYYTADWCAQLRPTESGTLFTLRGLQDDAIAETAPVGFRFFLHAAWVVQRALANAPAGQPHPELYPTFHDELAMATLAHDPAFDPPPEPVDASGFFQQWLPSLHGAELALGPLDPKKAAVARQAVPPNAAHLPVTAMLGDAGFLKTASVLVITPTHAFVASGDERASFAWSELTEVLEPAEDHHDVLARTFRLGWLRVPAGGRARALATMLRAWVAASNPEEDEPMDESET